MKYTKIPTNTFQTIQVNAGVLLSAFNPSNPVADYDEDLLGATTGGITFEATPSYRDDGEDIDNCPKNTMELKKLESVEIKASGSFVTANSENVKRLMAAADIDSFSGKITPRNDIRSEDFSDIWIVGDYSDKNGETNGGFIAIHLINALSTGGFKLKTSDKAKGTMDFEFTAHYSIAAQNVVPYEVYVKTGSGEDAEYEAATLTTGFEYGVHYYTRTGSGTEQSPYVYTEVAPGAAYSSSTTYYVRVED